jgi:hypothetical protein
MAGAPSVASRRSWDHSRTRHFRAVGPLGSRRGLRSLAPNKAAVRGTSGELGRVARAIRPGRMSVEFHESIAGRSRKALRIAQGAKQCAGTSSATALSRAWLRTGTRDRARSRLSRSRDCGAVLRHRPRKDRVARARNAQKRLCRSVCPWARSMKRTTRPRRLLEIPSVVRAMKTGRKVW